MIINLLILLMVTDVLMEVEHKKLSSCQKIYLNQLLCPCCGYHYWKCAMVWSFKSFHWDLRHANLQNNLQNSGIQCMNNETRAYPRCPSTNLRQKIKYNDTPSSNCTENIISLSLKFLLNPWTLKNRIV